MNSTSLLDLTSVLVVRVLDLEASKGPRMPSLVHPSLSPASCWASVAQDSVACIYSTFTSLPLLPGFSRQPSLYLPSVPCSAPPPPPPISLSVCLIAGGGHVVYLTQNRTPLLFQRVEPPSPGQDGGPGLNNALPPPETTETVNGL